MNLDDLSALPVVLVARDGWGNMNLQGLAFMIQRESKLEMSMLNQRPETNQHYYSSRGIVALMVVMPPRQ